MDLRRLAAAQVLLFMAVGVECVWRVRRQTTALVGDRPTPTPPPIPAPMGSVSYRLFLPNGVYDFGYDTGAGEHQSFRQESRDAGGRVRGLFGYLEPDGSLRLVRYVADERGYRFNAALYRRVAAVSRRQRKKKKKPSTARRPSPDSSDGEESQEDERARRPRPLLVGLIPVAPPPLTSLAPFR